MGITSAVPDFKQQRLCDHCWNGCHWTYRHDALGRKTSIRISQCEVRRADGTECQCPCRELLKEQKERLAAAKEERELYGKARK